MKKIGMLLCVIFFTLSCNVTRDIIGTYNLTQCEYKYNSISGLTLAGVDLQNVTSASLNPITLANLIGALSKNSIPLQFNINLDIKNPNYQPAILNGLQYILEIDQIEMTTGAINDRIHISTGQIAKLPINISFDLKKAMGGKTLDAIKNLAFNFAGIGSQTSNVTFKLKPSVNIGGKVYPSSSYIPVSFQIKN